MNKISPVVVMGIFYKSGFVLFSTIQHKYWNQGKRHDRYLIAPQNFYIILISSFLTESVPNECIS